MTQHDSWDKLPFVPAVSDTADFVKSPDDYLIICDGNSITRHGTSEDIVSRLGWRITAGMAASSEANDYAHLLAGKIQAALPDKKVKLLFSTLKEIKNVDPDLVIIQGGEHCHIEKLPEYEKIHAGLISSYQQRKNVPQIIVVSIWNPTCQAEFFECTGKNYQQNALIVREMQRENARKFNVGFADMSTLENIPENTGSGEVAAVRWHPSDAGMRAIAETVFKLWEKDFK